MAEDRHQDLMSEPEDDTTSPTEGAREQKNCSAIRWTADQQLVSMTTVLQLWSVKERLQALCLHLCFPPAQVNGGRAGKKMKHETGAGLVLVLVKTGSKRMIEN